jgi:hypothetical protein
VELDFQLQATHTQTVAAVAVAAEGSSVVPVDFFTKQVEMNLQVMVAVQALTPLLVMK